MDGLFIFSDLSCGDCASCSGCSFGDFIPDDQGFVNIQGLSRLVRSRKEAGFEDAKSIYNRAKDALAWANTPSSPRLLGQLNSEWNNVQAQPGPVYDIRQLNELLIQAMIEANAAHAGDLSWNAQKGKVFQDIEDAFTRIPETVGHATAASISYVGETAGHLAEEISQAAGQISAGAAGGLAKGLFSSPLGMILILGGGAAVLYAISRKKSLF